ncbi:MAG TPA: adenylate/guanylate cyclase domain-containing protein [Dehalococcoidia bacterium]|nr:adenylate/guanylate cyclase domain-containing protein [Dehalococcoidia bacterium]
MEPQIKYALTEDGVSIAYWTLGEGRPFVVPPGSAAIPSLRAWRTTEGREFLQRLAARRMVVRYDSRGFGASQASAVDFSPEARAQDLSAVIRKVAHDQVDLCAYLESGPAVLRYVSRNPERVSRLVLWGCTLREERYVSDEAAAILAELKSVDPDLYREAFVAAVLRHQGLDQQSAEYAQSLREAFNPTWEFAVVQSTDVEDLEQITMPALVLHRRGMARPSMAEIQAIAARLPNARLVLLDGDTVTPYSGDVGAVVAAMDEFLGAGEPRISTVRSAPGGLVTVLFTDIVGHTEMMQRLGDTKGRDVLREHERITRETLKAHGGAEVKTMGDGFMASFGSVTSAMDCAIALQRAFAAHSEQEGEPLHVRVGINAGEPIEEDGDLFGATVILASRIAAKADGGEILIPEPVRHLLSGKSFTFSDRGEYAMKGFDDAVRLYEVRWQAR